MNRAAVREVADLYYARFEARLEKGLAEVRSEMALFRSETDKGFSEVRSEMGKGLSEVRSEMGKLRFDMDKGFVEVRSEMDKGFSKARSELDSGLANQRADVVKWMFMFWLGTILPLAGLIIALQKL